MASCLAKIGLFVYEFVPNTFSMGIGIDGVGFLPLTLELSTKPVRLHWHVSIFMILASSALFCFVSNIFCFRVCNDGSGLSLKILVKSPYTTVQCT